MAETKTYKVTGPFVTHGAQPGEVFDAELDPDDEQRLIDQGAIELVTKTTGKAKTKEGGATDG